MASIFVFTHNAFQKQVSREFARTKCCLLFWTVSAKMSTCFKNAHVICSQRLMFTLRTQILRNSNQVKDALSSDVVYISSFMSHIFLQVNCISTITVIFFPKKMAWYVTDISWTWRSTKKPLILPVCAPIIEIFAPNIIFMFSVFKDCLQRMRE